MKKYLSVFMAYVLALSLPSCGKKDFPDLTDKATAFEMGEYIDTSDDDAAYGVIEFEGRQYMPYGTISRSINAKDTEACIGYIVQDGKSDKDERIYTLSADKEHNFLMQYYAGETEMYQPDFWRATDTKEKEISIPDYIESLKYKFWGE